MDTILGAVAPRIRRFARKMCKNSADAEDVVQDALLSIATHLDGFEGRSSVASWAFSIAKNACLRRRRGARASPTEGESALVAQPDAEPAPDERAADREMARIVDRAFDRLPQDYREVLLLRDIEGMSGADAAESLGLTIDALKSRLHRARAALREAIGPIADRGEPAMG